jgi:hypothetical protein
MNKIATQWRINPDSFQMNKPFENRLLEEKWVMFILDNFDGCQACDVCGKDVVIGFDKLGDAKYLGGKTDETAENPDGKGRHDANDGV